MNGLLIISIILAVLLIIAGCWIGILYADIDLYRKLAKDFKASATKSQKLVDRFNKDYENLLQISTEGIERNSYMVYLIQHLHGVIDYAGLFLKPRKKKEMYHRANNMMTYEQWVEYKKGTQKSI